MYKLPVSTMDRLDLALGRIADPAGEGNLVFTETFEKTARQQAMAADARRLAGRPHGPLDGRIVSIKALFDVAGYVTSAGTTVLRTRSPALEDAAAVASLKRAGAVVVGHTVMTEFAFSAVGINPHDGSPGNPRDRKRIAGGSSTGAAISVADGMSEIALGSDTGGSIRIPAALCGLVGFKPTSGKVSTQGAFPLSPTLDVAGPIAANVADCAAAFAVLSETKPPQASALLHPNISLTVLRGRLSDDADPVVAGSIAEAFARLAAQGVTLHEGDVDAELDALAELDAIGTFPSVELAAALNGIGVSSLDGVDPRTAARIRAGQSLSADVYAAMQAKRAQIIAMMERRLGQGQILALPTMPMTAVPIAEVEVPDAFHAVNMRLLRNPRVANLFDLPAISLPVPGGDLPVGLMLMAGRGQDWELLRIAAAVEQFLSA